MKYSVINIISGDPLSWIDVSRIPSGHVRYREVQKGMLNRILNNRFALQPLNENVLEDENARFVCDNWFSLRKAALYMACYRHRSAVMQSSILYELGRDARAFMELNKTDAEGIQQKRFSRLDLMHCAYTEIAGLTRVLPDGLRNRIRLLFPEPEIDLQACEYNNVLFTMALNHAKHYCA